VWCLNESTGEVVVIVQRFDLADRRWLRARLDSVLAGFAAAWALVLSTNAQQCSRDCPVRSKVPSSLLTSFRPLANTRERGRRARRLVRSARPCLRRGALELAALARAADDALAPRADAARAAYNKLWSGRRVTRRMCDSLRRSTACVPNTREAAHQYALESEQAPGRDDRRRAAGEKRGI